MDLASLEKLQAEVFIVFFFFSSRVYSAIRLIVWKNKMWIPWAIFN